MSLQELVTDLVDFFAWVVDQARETATYITVGVEMWWGVKSPRHAGS